MRQKLENGVYGFLFLVPKKCRLSVTGAECTAALLPLITHKTVE